MEFSTGHAAARSSRYVSTIRRGIVETMSHELPTVRTPYFLRPDPERVPGLTPTKSYRTPSTVKTSVQKLAKWHSMPGLDPVLHIVTREPLRAPLSGAH